MGSDPGDRVSTTMGIRIHQAPSEGSVVQYVMYFGHERLIHEPFVAVATGPLAQVYLAVGCCSRGQVSICPSA